MVYSELQDVAHWGMISSLIWHNFDSAFCLWFAATHEVSMTVPGLPKVSDQLSLEANQLALLLESHFGDVTDGSIHGVKVQDDRVVAITMDRKNITAEMSAERLRHHLINANEYSDFRQGADLGLEAVHSIQIRALHDLERQKRESTCTNLRDAISHVLRSQEFDLSELSVSFSCVAFWLI